MTGHGPVLSREAPAGGAAARARPTEPARGATGAAGVRAELVDPLGDGRWESFVAETPAAGVFHHRAWLALLNRTFGFPMTACCLVDAAGTIRAGARTALPDTGLRAFNLSWGAAERTLDYHLLDDRAPAAHERAGGSWSEPLIRRGPSMVGRLLGETHCRGAA